MNVLQTVIDGTTYLTGCPAVKAFQLVGSSCYHSEPKDVDFLVYIEDEDALLAKGHLPQPHYWHTNAGEYDDQDGTWAAMRSRSMPDVNLIVTVDKDWYDRAVLANEVCHALKLMDKGDRIVVYRIIRDGYNQEQANNRRDGAR